MSSAPSPASRGKAGSKPAEASSRRAAPSVRTGRASDLPLLVALEERSVPAEDRFTTPTWRRLLGPGLASGSAQILVIEGAGLAAAIVGLIRKGGRTARIYSLAVDPACRGRGLAGILLNALARGAERRGCHWLSLEVRETNEAALGLYGKLGFVVRSRLPAYYTPTEHGLRLRVAIPTFLARSKQARTAAPPASVATPRSPTPRALPPRPLAAARSRRRS